MEDSQLNNTSMEKSTILVTGASSGMGASTAKLLSDTHRVILCGRDVDRLQRVLLECNGNDNLIWPFDLGETDKIEVSLGNFLKQNNLTVAGLAHCAGMIKYVPVKLFSSKEFENIFKVNVISAAIIVKTLCSRKYNSSKLESVVFISSNISNFGAKAHALYSASKAGLDGLMHSLAVELAPKVRVNSVLPGAVETKMTEHIFDNTDLISRMQMTYPMGLGTTKDIAHAIKFLLSDESRWITGQQLTVDGGRTINLSV